MNQLSVTKEDIINEDIINQTERMWKTGTTILWIRNWFFYLGRINFDDIKKVSSRNDKFLWLAEQDIKKGHEISYTQ